MLRIHLLQHWFNLADDAVEEALYDIASLRHFAGIDLGLDRVPDETTLLKVRHLLGQPPSPVSAQRPGIQLRKAQRSLRLHGVCDPTRQTTANADAEDHRWVDSLLKWAVNDRPMTSALWKIATSRECRAACRVLGFSRNLLVERYEAKLSKPA